MIYEKTVQMKIKANTAYYTRHPGMPVSLRYSYLFKNEPFIPKPETADYADGAEEDGQTTMVRGRCVPMIYGDPHFGGTQWWLCCQWMSILDDHVHSVDEHIRELERIEQPDPGGVIACPKETTCPIEVHYRDVLQRITINVSRQALRRLQDTMGVPDREWQFVLHRMMPRSTTGVIRYCNTNETLQAWTML
jgi:hypothetical protein